MACTRRCAAAALVALRSAGRRDVILTEQLSRLNDALRDALEGAFRL